MLPSEDIYNDANVTNPSHPGLSQQSVLRPRDGWWQLDITQSYALRRTCNTTSLRTGRWSTPCAVCTRADRTTPSAPQRVSVTTPWTHIPRGCCGSAAITMSPTSTSRDACIHLDRFASGGRYSQAVADPGGGPRGHDPPPKL